MLSVLVAMAVFHTSSNPDFLSAGRVAIEMIHERYYRPADHLYAETFKEGKASEAVCFNWSCGVLLSALAAAARADARYKPWLIEFADGVEAYWNVAPPVAGFDVLPHAGSVDRYYDDNAWMVMALVEAFEITHRAACLDRAKAALTYVLSGEDDRLGGGIVWRESDKASKNTCSNSPSAAACLAVYRHTKEARLLAKAESLYAWTKAHLQDPADHLMWDNIDFSGKVEKTKWTYNTALQLRMAIELFALTHSSSYRSDAVAMAQSAKRHWVSADGRFKDIGKFAHLLYENLVAYDRAKLGPSVGEGLDGAIAFLVGEGRSADGFYPERWDEKETDGTHDLIDQASVARALFVAAGK
jgi:uncharacterized protein YyaL (SSP411 family)